MALIPALMMMVADTAAIAGGMEAIPIEWAPLKPEDLIIPVSDSVRAATWDTLAIKPSEPVRIRVACTVMDAFGAPGSCVSAAAIAPTSKTVDWPKVRDKEARRVGSDDSADVALLRTVTERLQAVRVNSLPAATSVFVIRIFDEVVSPEDARPPFVAGEALTMKDITYAKPIDTKVLGYLYPPAALRYDVTARVSLTCNIEADLKLLCRDTGMIDLGSTGATDTVGLVHDFRLASYQFASTLRLMPQDRRGNDVVGRQLKLALVWQMP